MPRKDEKKRIHDLAGIEDSADTGYLLVSHPDGGGGFQLAQCRQTDACGAYPIDYFGGHLGTCAANAGASSGDR